MNKKGFTLIELLAVIVVLAIIALIAVPIILNVIEKSKKGALKDSAYGIVETAELYLAKNMNKEIEPVEFKCEKNKCIECIVDENDKSKCTKVENGKELNYKGLIDRGRIKIYQNGLTSICIENGEYYAMKLAAEKEVVVAEGSCNYENEEYSADALISKAAYLEVKEELEELKNDGNANASQILTGKTALVKGQIVTGTMINHGGVTPTALKAGEIYTIPAGYHDGTGKVSAAALEGQATFNKKTQTVATGRMANLKSYTFVFDQLSKVDGVSSFSVGQSTSGGTTMSNVKSYTASMSISGNTVTINLPIGEPTFYSNWTCTAFETTL